MWKYFQIFPYHLVCLQTALWFSYWTILVKDLLHLSQISPSSPFLLLVLEADFISIFFFFSESLVFVGLLLEIFSFSLEFFFASVLLSQPNNSFTDRCYVVVSRCPNSFFCPNSCWLIGKLRVWNNAAEHYFV